MNNQPFDLVEPVLPAYDRRGTFKMESPPLGYGLLPPAITLRNQPTMVGGYTVNFPFGISASVLTRNSKAIEFYSSWGFDILTYKTVRSVQREPHDEPTWVFIDPKSTERVSPPFDKPVVGDS